MKKILTLFCIVSFCGLSSSAAFAAKPVDNDGDGCRARVDCNDNDPTVCELNCNNECAPQPPECFSCEDYSDATDCNADCKCQWSRRGKRGTCKELSSDTCGVVCGDNDGDGYGISGNSDCSYPEIDCNDNNPFVFPGATEICDDGIDNQCPGDPGYGAIDEGCGTGNGPHANLFYSDYPNNCLGCHDNGAGGNQYEQMWNSTHYQWVGTAEDMVNQTGTQQGKLTNAVNSYCINILGNWNICGSCHAGRGIKPGSGDTKVNIDCLMCHSEEYATQRKRLSEDVMGVETPTDSMVRNIHAPTRTTCLMCHAKAGGGDGVKRGDLSIATISNADANFDVHMNTAGSDLTCQSCHVFQDHKVIGKGSDIRPTDDLSRGAEVECTTCHNSMATTGHASSAIDRHVSRGKISCQVCHIRTYAKVATETHRDWRLHHDGTDATTCDATNPCQGHPHTEKAANLTPKYKWWNRLSDNYLLGDDASSSYNESLGTYFTSRPVGSFDQEDSSTKIYPFKYKTADQPKIIADDVLVALDTSVYLQGSGSVTEAIESGLVNMGYPENEPVEWVTTDTYQLINHGVEPKSVAPTCTECHDYSGETPDGAKMIPFSELGYHTWPAAVKNCTLCHSQKNGSWEFVHGFSKHQAGGEYNIQCYYCHTNEPTGFVKSTSDLCNDCHGYESPDGFGSDDHKKHIQKGYECKVCHTF